MTADDTHSLLEPGSYRALGVADDLALVAAMLRVEVAWMHALADGGAAKADQVDAVAEAAARGLALAGADVEAAGNPVLALVSALRAAVADADAAELVHRGLTSQDVLDTALMLLAREALARTRTDVDRAAIALARLAEDHRGSLMAGRTLTQHAVPITFGLKAAQWLAGVLDAADALATVDAALPVQVGGAAGTLSRAADLVPDPVRAATVLAQQLDLAVPDLPWHTRRTPVTRVGDALAETCQVLGRVANDVLLLGRPEIDELREQSGEGRGGSSTMPHKQNPVLSVLVRSAAMQAPLLAAQLHVCAGQYVDERPDGAWQAEWPSFRRLLTLTVVSSGQAAQLVEGLEVNVETMAARAAAVAADLLAERGADADGDPTSYLGATDAFIDRVLARFQDRQAQLGRTG
jgi:3-carboxy-cis,cis-muconate cycloisomerase